jgi:hypothetical protein
MKTLKLTNEQIELITQALGIAEVVFIDLHKDIMSKSIRTRGNNESKEQERIAYFYFNKACEFADLNVELTK